MVTIKAAAELTGLTVKAIRHYEQIGLVQPPLRTDAGYRLYSTENIFRLRQIQYYRELKFSLQEIAELLDAPRETVLSALTRQRQVVDECLRNTTAPAPFCRRLCRPESKCRAELRALRDWRLLPSTCKTISWRVALCPAGASGIFYRR